MNASLDRLWGSTLERLEMDICSQGVALTARVTSAASSTEHRLEFHQVSDVRFFSEIPGPWDYAEITEVHVNGTASGGITAEIMLWSEDAGLVITAASVTCDGQSVPA